MVTPNGTLTLALESAPQQTRTTGPHVDSREDTRAAGHLTAARLHTLGGRVCRNSSWLLGFWLIVAPWVIRGIDRTTSMILSNVIVGGCVVLLGLGVTAIARVRPRMNARSPA